MKASAPDTGRRLHAVLTGLCWLVPVGSAVYILCVYGGMPAVVGYHFAADGAFDLFGRKQIAFLHPMIAEAAVLALLTLCGRAAYRARPLRRLTACGNRLLAHTAAYLCSVLTIGWEILFSQWIVCVATQRPLPLALVSALLYGLSAAFVTAAALLTVALCALRTPRRDQKKEATHHGV